MAVPLGDSETNIEVRGLTTRNIFLRIGICFFVLFAFFGSSGSLIALLPVAGSSIDRSIRSLFGSCVQWVGIHLFHLTGAAATYHVQVGSDDALQWTALPVMLALALLAGILWQLFDGHKGGDLLGWLRLLVRITLAVALLRYGFIKVFPIQFPTPPLPVLNEPVGDTSPAMLFWSLYGIHPDFVMFLGWTEVIAGLALFFRRTAFFGSVLAFTVMANVALLDVTFNVPVKLYSLSLLFMVMAALLLAPEFSSILRLFLTEVPVRAATTWSPQFSRTASRRLLLGVELLVLVLACWQFSTGTYTVWNMKQQSARNPPAFTGGWRLQSGGHGLVGADGSPIVGIFFEPTTDTYFRAANGILWRSRAMYDPSHQHLRILYEVRGMLMFTVQKTDANDLILRPTGPTSADMPPLVLKRIPLPASYPLLQDHIRWISEFESLR